MLDDGSEIWPYPGAPGEDVASEVTDDSLDVVIDLEPGQYVLSAFLAFEAGDVEAVVPVDRVHGGLPALKGRSIAADAAAVPRGQ